MIVSDYLLDICKRIQKNGLLKKYVLDELGQIFHSGFLAAYFFNPKAHKKVGEYLLLYKTSPDQFLVSKQATPPGKAGCILVPLFLILKKNIKRVKLFFKKITRHYLKQLVQTLVYYISTWSHGHYSVDIYKRF